MKILCLDTEVTHLDTDIARVVELSLGELPDRIFYEKRFNPQIPIPVEATNVHGITDEAVANCPPFSLAEMLDVIATIQSFDAIIGYNPDFDIDVLRAEFKRADLECRFPRTVVCCKRMWDQFEPRPRRTLSDAYKTFVSPYGFHGAHGAKADVLATMDVFTALRAKHDEDGVMQMRDYDLKRATWCGPTDHFLWNDPVTRGHLIVNFGKYRGKTVGFMDNGMMNWIQKQDFPSHVKRICEYVVKNTDKNASVEQRDEVAGDFARRCDR